MEEKKYITVKKMIDDLNLEIVSGNEYLDNKIIVEMINRPGIELCGHFDLADKNRIVLIGLKEAKLIEKLNAKESVLNIDKLLSANPPAIIFSVHEEVTKVIPLFEKEVKKYQVPLLKSSLKTTPLTGQLFYYLRNRLADAISEHGVLVDVNGVGILIVGDSGIGKSETALELIKRGHILVADDLVEIKERIVGSLIGTAPKILRRFLEIRGVGIVDVISMFGASSYRKHEKINLVVCLEKWNRNKDYDRLGLDYEKQTYFNTTIPKIIIPVLPGRNIATLVESAALNYKLKTLGYDAAYTFTEAVAKKAGGYRDDETD